MDDILCIVFENLLPKKLPTDNVINCLTMHQVREIRDLLAFKLVCKQWYRIEKKYRNIMCGCIEPGCFEAVYINDMNEMVKCGGRWTRHCFVEFYNCIRISHYDFRMLQWIGDCSYVDYPKLISFGDCYQLTSTKTFDKSVDYIDVFANCNSELQCVNYQPVRMDGPYLSFSDVTFNKSIAINCLQDDETMKLSFDEIKRRMINQNLTKSICFIEYDSDTQEIVLKEYQI